MTLLSDRLSFVQQNSPQLDPVETGAWTRRGTILGFSDRWRRHLWAGNRWRSIVWERWVSLILSSGTWAHKEVTISGLFRLQQHVRCNWAMSLTLAVSALNCQRALWKEMRERMKEEHMLCSGMLPIPAFSFFTFLSYSPCILNIHSQSQHHETKQSSLLWSCHYDTFVLIALKRFLNCFPL